MRAVLGRGMEEGRRLLLQVSVLKHRAVVFRVPDCYQSPFSDSLQQPYPSDPIPLHEVENL